MPTKKELEEEVKRLKEKNTLLIESCSKVLPKDNSEEFVTHLGDLIEDLRNNKVSSFVVAWVTYEPSEKEEGFYSRSWAAVKFNDLYGLVTRLWRDIDNRLEERNKEWEDKIKNKT